MYDIIGDIHGYADKLEELLIKLGYHKKSKYYSHPERKVIFVGDYIDRGPQIKETLSIVRNMVDESTAIAILGNHEYNALCYITETTAGKYLRENNKKNFTQHKETLKQFEYYPKEWKDYLEWMKSLPLYLDLEDLRIVHAYWNKNNIKLLLLYIHNESIDQCNAIEETLKGLEHKIPNNYFFKDKDGHERFYNRVKWWVNPANRNYDECYFEEVKELSGMPFELESSTGDYYYPNTDPLVFCGHYWLNGNPALQASNVSCLDYSIAKGGILTAYRWYGEKSLNEKNLVWV